MTSSRLVVCAILNSLQYKIQILTSFVTEGVH